MEQPTDTTAPAGPTTSAEQAQQPPVPQEYAVCTVARRVWASLIDSACLVAMIGVQLAGVCDARARERGHSRGDRPEIDSRTGGTLAVVDERLRVPVHRRGVSRGARRSESGCWGCHIEADGAVTTRWRLLIRCLLKHAPLVGLVVRRRAGIAALEAHHGSLARVACALCLEGCRTRHPSTGLWQNGPVAAGRADRDHCCVHWRTSRPRL